MKEEKSKPVLDGVCSSKRGFKKKGSKVNVPSSNVDFFRGLQFSIGRYGPKIYNKTIDWLALYTSTQFKNGINVVLCLNSKEYIGPKKPVMPDKPTDNDKHIWEYKMNNLLKTEWVLKGNLQNLYMVLIALCDNNIKNQVKALSKFKEFDKKLGSMPLLKEIEKVVYTGGSYNLLTKHNKAMALQQERFQDTQEFRDQYMALWKVCTEVGIRFGQSKDVTKAILTNEGIDNPSNEQTDEA